MLAQEVYNPHYRGRWYDRLALNLDYHLKESLKALEIISIALKDINVCTGHRYSLLQRAKRICQSTVMCKKSKENYWARFENDPMTLVLEAPSVTILGRQLPHTVTGSTPLYVSPESYQEDFENVTVFKRVEDVAIRYYADNGYPEGIHGEGGTVASIFSLLMWDILFMDGIADVFYNEYQTFPLDLFSTSFFMHRQNAITERLQQLHSSTSEELYDMVTKSWTEHENMLCFGIRWNNFRDCQQLAGLVKCIGGVTLAGIITRLVEVMRHATGGVPDLVVWNTNTEKYKIVEVKGPGDRLSSKQILWLDYLMKLGVDCEVCLVKAVGAKKIQTVSS